MADLDIFTNVHKGIRAALFEACVRLGRTDDDDPALPAIRAYAAGVLHFVAHHGENEDELLLPLLEDRRPDLARMIADAHRDIEQRLAGLRKMLASASVASLYVEFTAFTALYLMHMLDEERFEPALREVLAAEDIASIGRQAVARTAPADQRLMLGFMVPAMRDREARKLLGNLPPALAAELAPLLV